MRLNNYLLSEGINDKGIFKACFMCGHPGCFDGNTLVLTKDGHKKISNIKKNDIVLTFNEDKNIKEWKKVDEKIEFKNHPEDILEIEFDNGEKIICTENHKFFINSKWVKAKNL